VDSETRFRALFELAYPPLCRYARHRGLTGPDVEDLVAHTLEIAWRRIDEVPADDPMPWLYAVARNLWRNHRRQQQRRTICWRGSVRTRRPVPPRSPWNQAPCGPRWHRSAKTIRRSCG
jgi:DNA-directed RNA polymerase specialized sigma24 family protein